MPANTKYLTQSKHQRFAKVSAAILGAFLVSSTLHLAIAAWVSNVKPVLATYSFSLFLLWCPLMLLTFLFKNGWKCWLLYIAVTLVFIALYAWGMSQNTIPTNYE